MRVLKFFSLLVVLLLAFSDVALAAEDVAVGGTTHWVAFAAGLAIAIAAFGGALAQGRVGAAALEAIGRNPGASGQMFVPMIIGLALIESLVIYAFVIALLIK